MLPRLFTFLALIALLCCTACTPVRTVYDEQGNLVNDDEPGGEKDLMSVYEKKFNNDFVVQKTKEGIPQTTSRRVSSFQSALNNARNSRDKFSTKVFDTGKASDLRSKSFDGASKAFNPRGKAMEKNANSIFARNLRPDFMNETHGISHSNRYRDAMTRSRMEGKSMQTSSYYNNTPSPYSTEEISTYFEMRRNKTEQPQIIDHREYYRQHKQGIRDLLGRDN